MRDRRRRTATLLLLGALAVPLRPAPAGGQTTDTVILRSGHPVIGEVQALQRGTLSLDTEEMDVVGIDWEDVARLSSVRYLEIELASQRLLFGRLGLAAPGMVVVIGRDGPETVLLADIVQMRPIETGFLARTRGFVDAGTNIARANRLASILAKARFDYRGKAFGLEVTGESYWERHSTVSASGDTTVSRTSRNSVALNAGRLLGVRWAVVAQTSAEQNSELSLDRRFLGLLGTQYRFVRRHGLELSAALGGAVNAERFTSDPQHTTAEAVMAVVFDAFDVGDVDVYATAKTYANPLDGGRLRVNLDARVAWEIIGDFTVGLNVTERYDSRPAAGAEQRDYQYAFSIGWTWG